MILEQKIADVESIGTEESIKMSIDTEDEGVLMKILSESLYKDPMGSLVREITSNALDAHREAKVDEPIIVSLRLIGKGYEFKVTDFGTGISPERVDNILSKYGGSTKRKSNEFIGGWGLGIKSPLSYVDSFTIITRWEGTEYTYNMYKGEDGTRIDLVFHQPTKERNGTSIIIPIEYGDYHQCVNKIKEQLCYFEGVYFDVPGVDNNFKIIKGDDWKYSSLNTDERMHISLDNVYYEIDWKRLGINQIDVPIALTFSVGDGIIPIPSREDVKYTNEVKALIKEKISKVAEFFVKKQIEDSTEKDHWWEVMGKFNSYMIDIEGVAFNVKPFKSFTLLEFKKPSLKGVKLLDIERLDTHREVILAEYEAVSKIQNGIFSTRGYMAASNNDLLRETPPYLFFQIEEQPKGVKLEYIKEEMAGNKKVFFLRKAWKRELGFKERNSYSANSQSYYRILNLRSYPRSQWREVIKEFQSIENDLISRVEKLENIHPTEKWLEERKANRAVGIREKVNKDQVVVNYGRFARRGNDYFTYENNGVKDIKDLGKMPGFFVYAYDKEWEKLEKIAIFHGTLRKDKLLTRMATPVLFNKYDIKKIHNVHNFIHIDEFMKGNHIVFRRMATALKIEKLKGAEGEVFQHKDFISLLSKDFSSKLKALEVYLKENAPSGYTTYEKGDILAVAEEHNLWDEKIIDIYKEVADIAPSFHFIRGLNMNTSSTYRNNLDGWKYSYKKEAVDLAMEICKARKIKMNWENYVSSPPTTISEEEEMDNSDVDDFEDEEEVENTVEELENQ